MMALFNYNIHLFRVREVDTGGNFGPVRFCVQKWPLTLGLLARTGLFSRRIGSEDSGEARVRLRMERHNENLGLPVK